MKKFKGHFWYPIPSIHPIQPVNSAYCLGVGVGTGPLRDIVVAYSKIYFKITPCKSKLLDPKNEKSRTCSKFEIFDHDPSFFNFSQKKASHLLMKKKSELLGQKMKNHLPAVN